MKYVAAWLIIVLAIMALIPTSCGLIQQGGLEAMSAPAPSRTATPAPGENPYAAREAAQAQLTQAAALLSQAQSVIQMTQDALRMAEAQAEKAEQDRLADQQRMTASAADAMATSTQVYRQTQDWLSVEASRIALERQAAEATASQEAYNAQRSRETQTAAAAATQAHKTAVYEDAVATEAWKAELRENERKETSRNVMALMGNSLCIVAPILTVLLIVSAGRMGYQFAVAERERRRRALAFIESRMGTLSVRRLPDGSYVGEPIEEKHYFRPGPNLDEPDDLEGFDVVDVVDEARVSPGGVTCEAPRATKNKNRSTPEKRAALAVLTHTIQERGPESPMLIPANQFRSADVWDKAVGALKLAGAVATTTKGTKIAEQWGTARNLFADIRNEKLILPPYPETVSQNTV